MNARHRLDIAEGTNVARTNAYYNPASIAEVSGLANDDHVMSTVEVRPKWFEPGYYGWFGAETHEESISIGWSRNGWGCSPGSLGDWC